MAAVIECALVRILAQRYGVYPHRTSAATVVSVDTLSALFVALGVG